MKADSEISVKELVRGFTVILSVAVTCNQIKHTEKYGKQALDF